jgi:hypothetical protein
MGWWEMSSNTTRGCDHATIGSIYRLPSVSFDLFLEMGFSFFEGEELE